MGNSAPEFFTTLIGDTLAARTIRTTLHLPASVQSSRNLFMEPNPNTVQIRYGATTCSMCLRPISTIYCFIFA